MLENARRLTFNGISARMYSPKASFKYLQLQTCILITQSAQMPQLETLLAYLLGPSLSEWVYLDAFETALKKSTFQNVILITNDFDGLQKKLASKQLQSLLKTHNFHVLVIQKALQPSTFSYTPHIRYVNALDGNLPPHQLKRELQRELRYIKKLMLSALAEASRSQRQALATLKTEEFRKKFESLIQSHYSNHRFTTADLATMMQVSTSTLERKTFQLTGNTPKQHLLEYRLQKAKQDLSSSNRKVGEVATTHGFASASYFSIRFFERFGFNPSQARQRKLAIE